MLSRDARIFLSADTESAPSYRIVHIVLTAKRQPLRLVPVDLGRLSMKSGGHYVCVS